MAIRNGYLYIGDVSNNLTVITSFWTPMPLRGPYKLSINNSSTFKVADESTFFGAYSANTTVKNKIYNDLRFQVNQNGNIYKLAFEESLITFSQRDPQMLTFLNLQNQQSYIPGVTKARYPIEGYNFLNSYKFYLSATFDDISLVSKINVFENGSATLSY